MRQSCVRALRAAAVSLALLVPVAQQAAGQSRGASQTFNDRFQPFYFGFDVRGGTAVPINSPTLGAAQNIDLGTGFNVSGGPFVLIPIGGSSTGTQFHMRFGADVFHNNLKTLRITNQNAPGFNNITGEIAFTGIMPTAGFGISILSDIEAYMFVEAGYGAARQKVELIGNNGPLVQGSATSGTWKVSGGVGVAVAPRLLVSVSAGYGETPGLTATNVGNGSPIAVGDAKYWVFMGGLTVPVFRNESSGAIVAWEMDNARTFIFRSR
jgi:hypothetical protein